MSTRLNSRHYVFPKTDHSLEECEDAVKLDDSRRRYALADGASEAFDARRWARRLVCSWIETDLAGDDGAGIAKWLEREGDEIHRSWEDLELPWFAEEKSATGSFAAFLGASFEESNGILKWKVFALGDACFLHLRGGNIRSAVPVSDHRDFNSAPPLVPSLRALQDGALGRAVARTFEVETGDWFLMMSDSIACWYLRNVETDSNRRSEFDELLDTGSEESVREFLQTEQQMGSLKDDDIAIIRLTLN